MEEKTYGQFNEEGICTCVSTYNTGIEAVLSNLGQRRVWTEPYETTTTYFNEETQTEETKVVTVAGFWSWQDVEKPIVPLQPTNAEIAQMISDLQADLMIAGVI